MLRYFFLSLFLGLIALVAIAGFQGKKSANRPIEIFPDMDHQPKFQPQHPSGFFADGRAARKHVEGTVPQGYTKPGVYSQNGASNSPVSSDHAFANKLDYYSTGRIDGMYGNGIPLELLDEKVLARGKERYNIHCAICHGHAGYGNGIVTNYGLVGPANFHLKNFREQPDGQIFNTITWGKNTMAAYGANIAVEDRWAIVAYIRALQRSQNATLADVPEAERAALVNPQPASAPAAPSNP